MEITAIRYEQEPPFDMENLPALEIIKDNKTLACYSVASLPYICIEVTNLGDQVAVVDKITIKIFRVKSYQPAVLPKWNYTIKLNSNEIFCRLNLSIWERTHYPNYPPPLQPEDDIEAYRDGTLYPPYASDFQLWPHFKVAPNDVDSFGLIIDSETIHNRVDYLITIEVHYGNRKTETSPLWVSLYKTSFKK